MRRNSATGAVVQAISGQSGGIDGDRVIQEGDMPPELVNAAIKWSVRITLCEDDRGRPIGSLRNELEIAHELLEKIAGQHPRSVEFLGNAWHIYEWLGPDCGVGWERFGTFIECVCAIAHRATPRPPAAPSSVGPLRKTGS